MQIRSIMTRHPSVVLRESTIADATRMMRDRHVAVLPVVSDLNSRTLVGVITDHDIVARCVASGFDGHATVSEFMTKDRLARVRPDDETGDALVLMSERGLRRIPVCEINGRLLGVVTLADVATRLEPRDPGIVSAVEHRISGVHLAAMR